MTERRQNGFGAICAGLLAGATSYAVMYRVFACLPIVALAILFSNAEKVRARETDRMRVK